MVSDPHGLPAIVQRLGVRDFRETLKAIYGAGMDTADIAALAPLVAGGSRRRRHHAREILVRAGIDLAQTVGTLINRLSLGDQDQVVSSQGAVWGLCPRPRGVRQRTESARGDRASRATEYTQSSARIY